MKYLLRRIVRILIICLIYGIFLLVSLRQTKAQILDSAFFNWTVYEIQENELDYKKCYIVAHPIKSDSDNNARLRPHIMITRFQKNRSEEVSIYSGFEYKSGSEVIMLVGDTQFRLLSKGDIAWARTKAGDVKIISTLLYYDRLKVRSDSAIGNYAVDDYSLKGITKAYARMREVCR